METNAQEASKALDQIEKEVLSFFASTEIPQSSDETKLAQYRDASQNVFFANLDFALSTSVEIRLWAAHGALNRKFRKWLKSIPHDEYKRSVERRKAEKLYLEFIKSSLKYYRGFVQRLASHFKGVREILDVARKFHLDTTTVDARVAVTAAQKAQLLKTCHATLIKLGDLSRYQVSELHQKERNWGPAKGYYDLAATLDPTSGQAFNQMSVIAHEDHDHLRVLYYIFRSLATSDPFPEAANNLEMEFNKIRKRILNKQSLTPPAVTDVLGNVGDSFITYHLQAYDKAPFEDWTGQLSTLLLLLTGKIKVENTHSILQKIVLINIASAWHTAEKIPKAAAGEHQRHFDAFAMLQSLNVATFSMLLRLLSGELEQFKTADGSPMLHETFDRLTPVVCRILPCIRLYNSWLLSNIEVLLTMERSGLILEGALSNFWATYCDTLTLIMSTFPVRELPKILYQLDEDQGTLSFQPFRAIARKIHYEDGYGASKPARIPSHLPDSERPQREMLFRLKDFVVVGILLHKDKDDFGSIPIPVVFGGGQFNFIEPEDIGVAPSQVNGNDTQPTSTVQPITKSPNSTVLLSASPRLPNDSPRANSRPPSTTFTAQDLVRQIHQSSPVPGQGQGQVRSPSYHQSSPPPPPSAGAHHPHRSSLSSILPTPFTPFPGELPNSNPSSRPGTSHTPNQMQFPTSFHNSGTQQTNYPNSSAVFNQEIQKMQHEIQNRTSPIATPDFTPSEYATPTGFDTFVRGRRGMNLVAESPSWVGSAVGGGDMQLENEKVMAKRKTKNVGTDMETEMEIRRKVELPSKYGAIGGERRSSKGKMAG